MKLHDKGNQIYEKQASLLGGGYKIQGILGYALCRNLALNQQLQSKFFKIIKENYD